MTDKTTELMAGLLERANRRLFIGAVAMAGAVIALAAAKIVSR